MAEKSFPLENTVYTAEDASLWFATRTSGVHASNQLGVTAAGGLTVNVGAGVAWLKYADFAGVSYANTEIKTLQLATANANYPRIDRVVIRYSKSESRVYLAVKSGTAASSPSAPDVTRNADTYEISLAQIRVNAGATSISASNITDERLSNSVCGLMSDGVTSFDPDEGVYAPAGYGLGGASTRIDDWNTATQNGFYSSSASCINGPTDGSQYHGMMINYSQTLGNQFVFKTWSDGSEMWARRYYNGNFEPWECLNPPMSPGKEYRTTERYNGKVVYTKLINVGTLPNTDYASVQTGVNYDKVFSVNGIVKTNGYTESLPLFASSDGAAILTWWLESDRLNLKARTDLSKYTAMITIKYIKD